MTLGLDLPNPQMPPGPILPTQQQTASTILVQREAMGTTVCRKRGGGEMTQDRKGRMRKITKKPSRVKKGFQISASYYHIQASKTTSSWVPT